MRTWRALKWIVEGFKKLQWRYKLWRAPMQYSYDPTNADADFTCMICYKIVDGVVVVINTNAHQVAMK